MVSAWDQPVGDTGGRLKGGKKRNQAISHLSYLSKAVSLAANLPAKFFFTSLPWLWSFTTMYDVIGRFFIDGLYQVEEVLFYS